MSQISKSSAWEKNPNVFNKACQICSILKKLDFLQLSEL